MKLEQRLPIAASREAVWEVLTDVPRAAGLIPGVGDVVPTGGDAYQGTIRIGIGPMRLNLKGDLTANADVENHRWRIEGHAQDPRLGGGVRVIVEASIQESAPDRSELSVSTDIQFMGRLGTLGQPLIRSKANSMMKDFVSNLERESAKS